jgi:RND family efflux transporter MFP subunit
MINLIFKKGMLPAILIFSCLFLPGRSPAMEIEAITKPSSDVMLSFVRGGRVKEVHVSEGDIVQEGQLLATLENEVELLQLKQLEVQAGNTSRMDSVKLEITQKEKDAEKLEWAKTRGAVTNWEVDHNKIDLQTAKISLRQARIEHSMTKIHRDEMQAQLELLSIHSPINGRVERVQIEPGESPQPLTPVIRVVRINPLLIDVHVPLNEAHKLSLEQPVSVKTTYEMEEVVEATIKHIAAVADAASMTLRIQLELANPTQRPAGERVQVQF